MFSDGCVGDEFVGALSSWVASTRRDSSGAVSPELFSRFSKYAEEWRSLSSEVDELYGVLTKNLVPKLLMVEGGGQYQRVRISPGGLSVGWGSPLSFSSFADWAIRDSARLALVEQALSSSSFRTKARSLSRLRGLRSLVLAHADAFSSSVVSVPLCGSYFSTNKSEAAGTNVLSCDVPRGGVLVACDGQQGRYAYDRAFELRDWDGRVWSWGELLTVRSCLPSLSAAAVELEGLVAGRVRSLRLFRDALRQRFAKELLLLRASRKGGV